MALTDAEKYELLALKTMKLSRESMEYFTTWTFPDYEVNWHHRLMCDKLDEFIYSKKINRLMIFTAPRHGKSEIVSRRLPALLLGMQPNTKIIACSYSSDLSSMMNRDVQRIIDSDEYKRIFPNTRLSGSNVRTTGNWLRNSDIFEIVNHTGAYRSTGVGGGITGSGANCLIIDDPCKNQEEADSQTMRQKVWDWYTSTAYTRLEKNGKVIIIMTRWHEDDLAGRLLALAKSDPSADQWTVLMLPAIAENERDPLDQREPGQPLWPNKYNLERLKAMQASVGTRVWNALFQQRPSSAEGGLFKRVHWQYYDNLPPKFDTIIQSWDLAFKGKDTSDFVAGHVIGKLGANYYLLDRLTERLTFTESLKAVRQMSVKWPGARAKLVEDKANGSALVDVLKTEISGLILVEPRGGKIARAEAITPFHEAGNLWLPSPARAPWIHQFVDQHANFPNVKNDDDVDAFSQGVTYLGGDPRERLKKLLGN
jgi:predicted phage terminase large subunit-like protein